MDGTTSTSMADDLFSSTSTPLYSTKWTPSTTGQYTGTCIFLIILAVIFRALFSCRTIQEDRWRDIHLKQPPVNREKDVGAGNSKGSRNRPWRISTDVPRALLDTVIAGVGYLLMLAVMTLNVGYFLSVLGGVFLGSLLFGRYGIHFAP